MISIGSKYMLCQTIRKLEVGDSMYNDEMMTELIVSNFPNLQSIDIGCNSFTFVRTADFTNLPKLRTMHIGYASFRRAESTSHITGDDGICCIEKCDQLKTIKFADFVFYDYHTLQIKGKNY